MYEHINRRVLLTAFDSAEKLLSWSLHEVLSYQAFLNFGVKLPPNPWVSRSSDYNGNAFILKNSNSTLHRFNYIKNKRINCFIRTTDTYNTIGYLQLAGYMHYIETHLTEIRDKEKRGYKDLQS